MGCVCPLPNGKVPGVGCRSYQPFTFPRFANSDRWFEKPKGFSVWLATIIQCLSAFLPLRLNPHLTSCGFSIHCKTKHTQCPSAFLPLRHNPHLTSCGFSLHCKTKHTQCPSAFLPLRHNINLTPNIISFRCNKTHNLTPNGILFRCNSTQI